MRESLTDDKKNEKILKQLARLSRHDSLKGDFDQ